jgi:hypothetical protein
MKDITKEIMEEFDKYSIVKDMTFYEIKGEKYLTGDMLGSIRLLILSALEKQRAEFRRVIESKRKSGTAQGLDIISKPTETLKGYLSDGYNQCLDDLLLEIKE